MAVDKTRGKGESIDDYYVRLAEEFERELKRFLTRLQIFIVCDDPDEILCAEAGEADIIIRAVPNQMPQIIKCDVPGPKPALATFYRRSKTWVGDRG